MPEAAAHSSRFDFDPSLTPQVYLTADIAGIGGRIKERHEDFLVEEQPLYAPVGEGEHIYMLIEKRGLTTTEMVRRLARKIGMRPRDISYAGLKDKHAITRQIISIHAPGKPTESLPSIDDDRMSALWVDRHTNKLKRGHLKGNRFSIKIRGVGAGESIRAQSALSQLASSGVPNRFGEQRFGSHRTNHLIGRAMVRGDAEEGLRWLLGPIEGEESHSEAQSRGLFAAGQYQEALDKWPGGASAERRALQSLSAGATPEQAFGRIDTTQRTFWLSALQSAIFNHVLDERISSRLFAQLDVGDIACKLYNNALFDVGAEELAAGDLVERMDRFEISPTGPLWGPKMKRCAGARDEVELRALEQAGVTVEDLVRMNRGAPGARRALRVPLIDPDLEAGADEHGEYIRIAFELSAGSFATVVLQEIMKPERVQAGDKKT